MARPMWTERRGWHRNTARGNERRSIDRAAKKTGDSASQSAVGDRMCGETKGRPVVGFRDRHADRGKDLVLYFGRKAGGVKLNELAHVRLEGRSTPVWPSLVKRYETHLGGIGRNNRG
jgi:hypothetical protein